ncbi:HNH endonuclease [bacterium]|nr:HNH endonuclease [bacterium]
MNKEIIRELFNNINIWKKNGQRALHKPLLLLWALGRLSQGNDERFTFQEVKDPLTEMLIEYSPPRKSYHPEQPFWRLQNDALFKIEGKEKIRVGKNGNVLVSDLKKVNPLAGFKQKIVKVLCADPKLIYDLVKQILERHFQPTQYQDVLSAVGFDFQHVFSEVKRKRDSRFRQNVMDAYGWACCVCGLKIQVGKSIIGNEAAHIKWHNHGGPDIVKNGIVLCPTHHKMFDFGIFTMDKDRRILVSGKAHGDGAFQKLILNLHGKEINKPVFKKDIPDKDFIYWHQEQVFRSPAREM